MRFGLLILKLHLTPHCVFLLQVTPHWTGTMMLGDIFPWILYLCWLPVGWILYPVRCIWTSIHSLVHSSSGLVHINSNRYISNPNWLRLCNLYEFICSKNNSLGKGGYGEVFRGRNVHTQEEVAVKIVEKSDLTQKYIERELTFTKLSHKNIIRVLWTFEDKYFGYFVMEYCPYSNLNTFMKDRKIALGLCLSFMRNLAEAVLHIHQRNISHRDINPWNILVKRDEDGGYFLLLADFGLARDFPLSSTAFPATGNTGNIVTSL